MERDNVKPVSVTSLDWRGGRVAQLRYAPDYAHKIVFDGMVTLPSSVKRDQTRTSKRRHRKMEMKNVNYVTPVERVWGCRERSPSTQLSPSPQSRKFPPL